MHQLATLWNLTELQPIATGEAETALIAAAQSGDEQATLRLFVAYLPVLRKKIAKFRDPLGIEDARQVALLGLTHAIAAFDATRSDRLASVLRQHVAAALAKAVSDYARGATVASRTRRRFFKIVDLADGDLNAARALAPQHAMSLTTFDSVRRSLNVLPVSIEDAIPNRDTAESTEPGYSQDEEDQRMVDAAFAAVTSLEARVCRLAYGFEDYEPLPDAEIGHRLGIGRVKTLRVRNGALSKMADALAA